jgi:hypothetical protein
MIIITITTAKNTPQHKLMINNQINQYQKYIEDIISENS